MNTAIKAPHATPVASKGTSPAAAMAGVAIVSMDADAAANIARLLAISALSRAAVSFAGEAFADGSSARTTSRAALRTGTMARGLHCTFEESDDDAAPVTTVVGETKPTRLVAAAAISAGAAMRCSHTEMVWSVRGYSGCRELGGNGGACEPHLKAEEDVLTCVVMQRGDHGRLIWTQLAVTWITPGELLRFPIEAHGRRGPAREPIPWFSPVPQVLSAGSSWPLNAVFPK